MAYYRPTPKSSCRPPRIVPVTNGLSATADHAAAKEDENVAVIVPPAPAVANPPVNAWRELDVVDVSYCSVTLERLASATDEVVQDPGFPTCTKYKQSEVTVVPRPILIDVDAAAVPSVSTSQGLPEAMHPRITVLSINLLVPVMADQA